MQIIIVIIILALAIAFTGYRVYKALTHKDKRCYGCPLKDLCDKKKKE